MVRCLLFAALLSLVVGHLVSADDSCDYNPSDYAVEENSPDHYQLFSTKTQYLVAREEIKKHFDSSWPPEVKQCRPIYLYLLARHAIRYPKASDIKFLSQLLYNIRNELLYSKNISYKMFLYFANWRFRMVETDDNHVAPNGKNETARIAEIYHDYFPELLDLENTTFNVGVSTKIRTEETADAFIDSLIRKQLDNNASVPDLESRLQEIKEEKFKKTKPELLMSHRHCKSVMKSKGKKPTESKDYEKMANSDVIKQMLIDFSERNGLSQTLSIDSMLGIYRACSYETAIYGFSPWCLLFRRSELKKIEYLLDIDEYHDAYEITEHRKMACPVIVDLKSKVESIMKQETSSSDNHTNATLYFSHENLLSKVWSYLKLFQRFPKPSTDSSPGVLCIPKDREWRASLVVPFGTNFAAILYKCPPNSENQTFKLLTLVNEIPVVIRGCDSPFCHVEQFFREFDVPQQQCNVDYICGL